MEEEINLYQKVYLVECSVGVFTPVLYTYMRSKQDRCSSHFISRIVESKGSATHQLPFHYKKHHLRSNGIMKNWLNLAEDVSITVFAPHLHSIQLCKSGIQTMSFVWDMTSYEWVSSVEGHSDSIIDVRFKPSSHVFTTSSFYTSIQLFKSGIQTTHSSRWL